TILGTALAYIALAFFIARISLAAAIAAGDAGLSGAGCCCCCCCAPAGTPVRANPSARPAANRIPERLFIPILLDCGSWPFNNANSLRAGQHRDAGKTNEQPVLDHARYRVQQSRQARRIGYLPQIGIDNPGAAIGEKSMATPAFSDRHVPGNAVFRTCPADGALRRREAERNDLHR